MFLWITLVKWETYSKLLLLKSPTDQRNSRYMYLIGNIEFVTKNPMKRIWRVWNLPVYYYHLLRLNYVLPEYYPMRIKVTCTIDMRYNRTHSVRSVRKNWYVQTRTVFKHRQRQVSTQNINNNNNRAYRYTLHIYSAYIPSTSLLRTRIMRGGGMFFVYIENIVMLKTKGFIQTFWIYFKVNIHITYISINAYWEHWNISISYLLQLNKI